VLLYCGIAFELSDIGTGGLEAALTGRLESLPYVSRVPFVGLTLLPGFSSFFPQRPRRFAPD